MYPDTIPVNEGKSYWTDGDIFQNNPMCLIKTCLHQNYNIGMHSHEFYEINIVLSGKGCHYIEKRRLEVNAGDVFVIPSEIRHGYIGDRLDVYHFLVRGDFLARYRNELDGTKGYKLLFDIEPYLRKSVGDKYFLHFNKEELFYLRKEIENIEKAEKKGEYTYMNVLSLSFFCRLCVEMYDSVVKNDVKKSDTDIIGILDYIHSNFSERITVEKMARFVNMSKATFNRHFKRAVGTTPMEYVIGCRTKRAKELIGQNAYTKAEIAQMCGFYDSSHLDKYLYNE